MNNVLYLDNIVADGSYFSLEHEQQDEIAASFSYTYSCPNINQEDALDFLLKGEFRNRNNVISKLYNRISQLSDLEIAATYKIAVHLAEILDENDNIFEHEPSLSEADVIVKAWGNIIKKRSHKLFLTLHSNYYSE